MKISIPHIASMVIAVILAAGCATQPPPAGHPRNVAILMSAYAASFTLTGSGPVISVVEVDGKPVDKPHGPVELQPGTHSVTMKCDGSVNTTTVTVSAGEVYQFGMATTAGVKGCVGSLSRVHSANP